MTGVKRLTAVVLGLLVHATAQPVHAQPSAASTVAPDAAASGAAATSAAPAAAPAAPAAASAGTPTPTPAPAAAFAQPAVLGPTEKGFPTPAPTPAPALPPSAATPVATGAEVAPPTAAVPARAEPAQPAAADAVVWHFSPGHGLMARSNDGKFSFSVGLLGQFLEELHLPHASSAANRNYLLIPMARAIFWGNLFTPDFRYRLELGFSGSELGSEPANVVSDDGQQLVDSSGKAFMFISDRDLVSQSPILDFYVELTQLRDAQLRVGQTKVPFGRETLIADGELSYVRRSLASLEFDFARDIGIGLHSDELFGLSWLRYYAGVYSAELRNSTLQSLGAGDLGLLYVGRLELMPLGAVSNTPRELDAGSSNSRDPKLSLGVAYAFVQSDASGPYARQALGHTLGPLATVPMVDFNTHNFTADALLRVQGLSVLGSVHYRKAAPSGLPGGARDGVGLSVQAGYLLDERWPLEVVGMYSQLRRSGAASDLDAANELVFGLNYYLQGHALKLQADYAHLWLHTIAGSDDNRLRLQLQVAL